ncbi:hypothetical protein P691DRAFT_808991 [Macrolepiota fuliginosa MF-IS2]|uniref:Pheromone n=1 Tax=Macrolepiota fuliginosa MF-IS2 TaxID=1400762 RepID=A0A9P6C796_9AGAR|nr:hypothetical protein P691DRAFT_808991 [Macrolepiota fuliginosa MF-IS2]
MDQFSVFELCPVEMGTDTCIPPGSSKQYPSQFLPNPSGPLADHDQYSGEYGMYCIIV